MWIDRLSRGSARTCGPKRPFMLPMLLATAAWARRAARKRTAKRRSTGSVVGVVALLVATLSSPAAAAVYEIRHFTQTSGASSFSDPFDSGGPPPEGAGAQSYAPFGTFQSGDEHTIMLPNNMLEGVLDLHTSRGFPGPDLREIGATVNVPTFFFSSGPTGLVEAFLKNLNPTPGEFYQIAIQALAVGVSDAGILLAEVTNGYVMK